jgi:hypothetical protein
MWAHGTLTPYEVAHDTAHTASRAPFTPRMALP